MRRTKTVLAVVAVMAAMLVAFAAPAMANNGNGNGNGNNHHYGWNNWNNWDRFDYDRGYLADDCEWEFEEGWFLGYWGWQWGTWFLDC